jgi:serine beta-lactamase-like protein LACTB
MSAESTLSPLPPSSSLKPRKPPLAKRILAGLLVLIAGAAVLLYFLFEPLVRWPFGWKPMPAETTLTLGERKVYKPEYSQKAALAQAVLERAQKDLKAPAISVAVGIDGELVWAEARGFADVDSRTPAKLDTRFRIGSTSKAVTATAMAKLFEAGKLDLDAPVQRYAAYFPEAAFPVTTRQVLSHLAGFRDYRMCFCFPVWEYQSTRQYDTVKDSLAILAGEPLEAVPGTRFKYSSPGFNVAGAVAEGAAGKPFPEFLSETLFAPLDMRGTSPDYRDRDVPNRARFYHVKEDNYRETYAVNNSGKWPAGGLVSTPGDLVRMGNALLAGTYVRPDVRDQFFTPQKLKDGTNNPQGYALGWRSQTRDLFRKTQSLKVVHHGGTAAGGSSYLVLFPDQKLVVSLLMNLDSEGQFKLHETAYAIAEIFLFDRVAQVVPVVPQSAGGSKGAL